MGATGRPSTPEQEPVAVIGISALMPGSSDIDGFWRTVVQGRDLITDVPPTHWLVSDYYDPDPTAPDRTYGHRGAFLDPVEFDPLAFGLPPSALPATDTSQALTLTAAQRLLDDVARCSPAGFDPDRVSVILGAGPLELLTTMANRMQRPVWAKVMREAGLPEAQVNALCDRIADHYVPWQEATLPGLLSNVVAGRVANRFDFHGSNYTTDAACAGSLAALSSAVNELSLRHADMVVTGGVDTLNDVVWYTCFSKTPALSRSGDCRPFSADSDGMVLGEGVVLFALKRLADAERDHDAIYAVIRGLGASSDGRGTAVYAPLPEGQVRALRRAYESCGYTPDTVELMEAHGTGTPAGDAAEVTALHQVFGEAARSAFPWCALGSLKSQFGHTKSAAGAAGLLKAVLALHHKVLPPTIKVTRPSQSLRRPGSPFEVNTVVRPWIRGSAHPRRASVSSFGFGGTNFHVTAEEYVPRNGGRRPYRTRTAPSELVPLVAVSAEGVVDMCHAIAADHRPLAPVAREAQSRLGPGRRSDPPGHRLAIVAADTADLHRKAQQAAARLRTDPLTPFSTPDGVHYRTGPACRGRVAFLFPGQGSQYVGMGADLAMHVPAARTVWDRLADVELGDLPLHRVVFPAPPFSSGERDAQTALLTATEWAQPAVAAHSMALMAVLDALGVQPDCVAGHSLGELTALHAAGALDAGSLLRLTRLRGRLMRDAAREPGGMLAVRAPARDVEQAIRATGRRDLWIANRNAPEQVVVSGGARSLAVLQRRLDERGIPARPLPVSAAFHSPLVRSAARPLLDHVRDLPFAPLKTVVYGNADAAPYPSDTDELPERLARQLVSPVLFADQVAAMYEDGVRVFVEVGPGSVLTGLVGANLGKREHLAIALDRQGKDGLTALHQGLAALVAHGVPLDCTPLWHDHAATPPAGPPNSRATVLICGTNYGKPYPPAAAQEIAPPSPEPEPDDRPGPDAEVPNQPEVSPAMPQPAHGPSRRPPAGPQSPHGSPNGETAWIETLLEVHRLAAEAHTAYQRATADAHLAYLAAVDRSLNPAEAPPPVNRAAERDPAPVPPPAAMEPAPMMPPPEPVQPDQPAQDDVFDADTKFSGFSRFSDHSDHSGYSDHSQFSEFSEPVPSLSEPAAGAAQTSPTPAPVSPASVSPTPANGSPPGNGRSADDLTALTLEVVAEKTGFPVEILTPQMHLQADLGVDSIKRVEVLSALRDRIEGLPSLDAAELGRLQTIGEITDRLAVEAGG